MLPQEQFDLLVKQCGSDRYYKTFYSWDKLIVMLFGIFSRCDHLHYKRDKIPETLCLRLVYYKDEKWRKYRFITKNWEITLAEVALIYKYRWTIELTFKKLKQNFQLHLFYLETENGIKTQIWCTLIAHLLLNVVWFFIREQKSIFHYCYVNTNTVNKPFGFDVSCNQRA